MKPGRALVNNRWDTGGNQFKHWFNQYQYDLSVLEIAWLGTICLTVGGMEITIPGIILEFGERRQ